VRLNLTFIYMYIASIVFHLKIRIRLPYEEGSIFLQQGASPPHLHVKGGTLTYIFQPVGGPSGPPQSPDFNTLAFFLWESVQCTPAIVDREEMQTQL
jgi:hypothetical protein